MKHNWGYKPFAEICITLTPTSKIGKSEYLSHGQYPIISQEDIYISGYWNDKKDITLHSSPVIIFGDHSRVLKYVDFEFVVGADGVKIIQPIGLLDAKFLYHFLRWYNVPSLGYSRHFKLLKEANYPVPPMETQKQIVAELDQINDLIAKNRELLSQLDALAQSLFYDTFGDPSVNPKYFPLCALSDIYDAISTGITYKPEMVAEDGTIVLRSSNIQESKFVLDDIVRVQMQLKESQYVKKNDILMCSRNGSARLVGKVCLIPDHNEKMSWGAFMTIIRSKHFRFLFHYFRLPAFREQLKKTKTSTVNHITIGMLKGIKLPFPPLALQEDFGAKVEAIESQKAKVEAEIAELQTLLNARMDYWFN